MKMIKESSQHNATELKKMSEQRRNAIKYVRRDKHAAFFLPKAPGAKMKPQKKKKLKKPRSMTNKERRISRYRHERNTSWDVLRYITVYMLYLPTYPKPIHLNKFKWT